MGRSQQHGETGSEKAPFKKDFEKSKILPDVKNREMFLLKVLTDEVLPHAMRNVLSPCNRNQSRVLEYCFAAVPALLWRRMCTKLYFQGLPENI